MSPPPGERRLEELARVVAHVDPDAKAAATASAVMSSWVGPIPPDVNTCV
ncbi:hypothetical protein [Georgenia sp. SUBG003]